MSWILKWRDNFEKFTNFGLILSELLRDYIEDVESEYQEQKISRFG